MAFQSEQAANKGTSRAEVVGIHSTDAFVDRVEIFPDRLILSDGKRLGGRGSASHVKEVRDELGIGSGVLLFF